MRYEENNNMKYLEKTVENFTAELASSAPTPGGGGAAALVGALGIALGNMVGELTVGKPKYAEYEGELRTLMAEASRIEKELLHLVDEDAEGFKPLAEYPRTILREHGSWRRQQRTHAWHRWP